MINKKVGITYLLAHVGLLAVALLLPLYRSFAQSLSSVWFGGCLLHDLLFLYCPLCGGTRALEALLQLDSVTAFVCNPLAVVLILLALLLDVWALIRLLRGHSDLLPIPQWAWKILVAVLVLYGILRNYLMIAHGVDPLGDLGAFWQSSPFIL